MKLDANAIINNRVTQKKIKGLLPIIRITIGTYLSLLCNSNK